MKKNIKRIISFTLMLSLLVGMMAGFSVFAAEENAETPKVEIVSKNVYFDDTLKLMYAVATDDENVKVNIYNANDELVETITEYNNEDVDGDNVNEKTFTSKYGVPAQDIDTVWYAEAVLSDGTKTDKVRYSVLEYLYERLTTTGDKAPTTAQAAMYNNLLAFADSADIVLNKATAENSIANYAYVTVTNGTLDGTYSSGMLMAGTALDELTTDYVVESGKVLGWEIEAGVVGEDASKATVKDEAIAEFAIEAGKVYTIKAISVDSDAPTIVKLATFAMGTQTSENTTGIKTFTDTDGSYTLTVTSTGGKMYKSVINGDSALKFGASSTKGDGAFNLTSNITKVVIHVCAFGSDSTTLVVNDEEYALTSSIQTIEIEQTTANAEWTVTFAAKNASKNRFYISTVEIYGYEQ